MIMSPSFNITAKSQLKAAKLTLKCELDYPQGQGLIGVFGESGAGKTSLLRLIAGQLNNPELCSISIADKNWQQVVMENNPCVLQPQSGMLFPNMTLLDNLNLVVKHSKWQQLPFTLEQVVNWCQLSPLLNSRVEKLSGGEQQRASFARSLLSGKPVMLLDEPFSALDWQKRRVMLDLIIKLHKEYGLIFIMVSHSLTELALFAQQVIHIEKGQVVNQGPVNVMVPMLSQGSGQQTLSQLQLAFIKQDPNQQFSLWQLIGADKNANSKEAQIYCRQYPSELVAGDIRQMSLAANQVSISLQVQDTSILNQLSGTITQLDKKQDTTLVSIDIHGQVILAEISKLSCQRLGLNIGDNVVAQFKAIL